MPVQWLQQKCRTDVKFSGSQFYLALFYFLLSWQFIHWVCQIGSSARGRAGEAIIIIRGNIEEWLEETYSKVKAKMGYYGR